MQGSVCLHWQVIRTLIPCGHCFCCKVPCATSTITACLMCSDQVLGRNQLFPAASTNDATSVSQSVQKVAENLWSGWSWSEDGAGIGEGGAGGSIEQEQGAGCCWRKRGQGARKTRSLKEQIEALESELERVKRELSQRRLGHEEAGTAR
mmetsp:Transcript_52890/g.124922  ORF Transcript_52890/g.124922 Transcript_52890/m.124922 type:complete len:150 (-) Transcript_52890:209-658(-)